MGLPFVEPGALDIGLQAFVFNDELHSLEKGGRGGWRLFPQQNVNGVGNRVTQLAFPTDGIFAAFGIFAVRQAVWKIKEANPQLLTSRQALYFCVIQQIEPHKSYPHKRKLHLIPSKPML